jgi:dolichyl-diphosphooligosaccharide--protein glycosyltransferase
MPTMIIFALFVGIFTLVQFIFDFHRGRTSDYLLFINTVVFLVAYIGVALFGIKYPGLELSTYSAGHLVAFAFLIIGTIFLYVLSRLLKEKNRYMYPLTIFGIGLVSLFVMFIAAPTVYSQFISNLMAFFGSAPVTTTIQEARGWDS